MRKLALAAILLPLLSGGCAVGVATSIVTAPIKAGAKVADWTTTSQDEADRNYGRKVREQEARDGREAKKRAKACRKNPRNCDR